ncbi:MAG: hypothetical protein ACYTGZ_00855 [Planctomycetota bacterium]|jgi:hypothetical protein
MRRAFVALTAVLALVWLGFVLNSEEQLDRAPTTGATDEPPLVLSSAEGDAAGRTDDDADSRSPRPRRTPRDVVRRRNRGRAFVRQVVEAASGAQILVLDVGRYHGVKVDDRLQLQRQGDVVGCARVQRVMGEKCVAEFETMTPGPAAPARAGDSAFLLDAAGNVKPLPPPLVEAVFKIAEKTVVTVTVNTLHRVRQGDELKIMRGEDFVARFKVEQASNRVVIGELTHENLGRIGLPRNGDRVELP